MLLAERPMGCSGIGDASWQNRSLSEEIPDSDPPNRNLKKDCSIINSKISGCQPMLTISHGSGEAMGREPAVVSSMANSVTGQPIVWQIHARVDKRVLHSNEIQTRVHLQEIKWTGREIATGQEASTHPLRTTPVGRTQSTNPATEVQLAIMTALAYMPVPRCTLVISHTGARSM